MTANVRALVERYRVMPAAVRAIPPLLWMALLWWSSSRSGPGLDAIPSLLRNGGHVLAYGVLGLLLWLLLGGTGWSRPAGAMAIACVYAIVDEVHQAFVPGRIASVADVLSDTCGAGLSCCWLWWRMQGDRRGKVLLPWLLLGAAASVAAATWLSW